MNVDKFIEQIEKINILIEDLTKADIRSGIRDTKSRIRKLSNRIKRHRRIASLPYTKVFINFQNKLSLSVRAADKKVTTELNGKMEFDVVGFSDNYFILQNDDWEDNVGLKLTYRKLETYIDQQGTARLFYNKNDDVSSGIATRNSPKEDVFFIIDRLVER